MKYLSSIAVVPLRSEPSHRSEMISQLLYGESVEIIDTVPDWVQIKCHHDEYLGWADSRSFKESSVSPSLRVVSRSLSIELDGHKTELPFGALITNDNFNTGIVSPILEQPDSEPFDLLDLYLNEWMGTPYLWGGRSTFGADCSGLVQVVYGALGIILPRDASQQILHGESIQFHERKKGDLAFFANSAGGITHVGIIMGTDSIIHASAWVRCQKITIKGIVDENGIITHQLAEIKRII